MSWGRRRRGRTAGRLARSRGGGWSDRGCRWRSGSGWCDRRGRGRGPRDGRGGGGRSGRRRCRVLRPGHRSGRGGGGRCDPGRSCRCRQLGGGAAGDQTGSRALDRRAAVRSSRRRRHRTGRVGVRIEGRHGIGNRPGGLGRRRRHLRGCGLLGGRRLLGRGCRLLGLHRSAQALAVGLPPGAVSLGVLDGRRVTLDAHPQREAEVERLFVGQSELVGELIDADLLRQRLLLPFLHVVDADTHIRPSILAHHRASLSEPCRDFPPEGDPSAARIRSTCRSLTGPCSARSKDRRFSARSMQPGELAHNHAPRPGRLRPMTSEPSSWRTTRTSWSTGPVRRHPMQVR